MAKIRDFAITVESAAVASMVMAMPVHATGDLLVAFVNKDTASNFTTPAGWTAGQTQVSAGAGGGVYYKRAASASETVTFTLTSETCCGVVIAVQNVNGTTGADAVSGSAKSGADDTTLPLTGVGITPSHDNCLILHGLSTDGAIGPNALPPWVNLFGGDTGANSLCVSYVQQKTAAAITAPDHWGGAPDDCRGFIIAIRDDGNGDYFDGYIPLGTTPSRQITPFNGSTGVVDKGTYALAGANVITSVNGTTVTGTVINTTADSGINPYRGSARSAGAQSKTAYSAVEINMTATADITDLNGLVFLTYMNLTPSDYKDCGTVAQGGKYFLMGSTSANYRAWIIGGFSCATEVADARNNVLIEFGTTDTDLVTLGTPDFTALDIMQFGAKGYIAACSMLVNELYLLNQTVLAGGSSTGLLDLDDLVFVVNNGNGILPLIQRAGVQATIWTPIKFGGTDPLFFAADKKVFAWPQKADGTDYVDFHVSNNKIGFEFDGQDRGAGDVDILHFTGCLFTSPSSYYWRFASTHDAGADIDFTGSTVINAAVTLRSTSDLDSVTFIDCSAFTLNGATITNCTFQNTKATAASPAEAALVSSSSFTSGGSGHAIEIGGTAADMTLTDVTFTGYSGTSTDAAIYVNIASGTMTISVSGGDTPSIRTAGATVTVVNAKTATVTVKAASDATAIQNARVLLLADIGGDLPVDETVTITNSGTTATVAHTAHGLTTGQKVQIKGASHIANNGVFVVTVTNANEYTYTMGSSPGSNPTGTIEATGVILEGLTNASGVISNAAFPFTTDQPVTGRARKGSSAPYFKTGVVSGTLGANGFDTTVFLVSDA